MVLIITNTITARDHVVWLNGQGRIWDAILIKDDSTRDESGTTTRYALDLEVLQLLYNVKTKSLRFWRSGLAGQVDSTVSNTAKSDFQGYFLQQTGLSWKNRWAVPKEGKYIFVPRIFEDVENEEPTALNEYGKKDTKLPPAVCEALAVTFDHRNKHSIEHSIKRISADRLSEQKWRLRLTLRAAKSLLERISEIVFDKFQRNNVSRAKLLSHLGRCYLALMWATNLDAPPKWDLPVSSEDKNWLKRERAGLELLYNLSFALDLMENSTKISKNQIINRAYRGLGLASMELGWLLSPVYPFMNKHH